VRRQRIQAPQDRETSTSVRPAEDAKGHPITAETTRAVREEFFWPGLRYDIQKLVHAYTTCATAKGGRTIAPAPPRARRPQSPWKIVALDLMDPYPKSTRCKRFILVATDMFSRWIEAFPIPKATVGIIAPLLEREAFLRWESRRGSSVQRPVLGESLRGLGRPPLNHTRLSCMSQHDGETQRGDKEGFAV
jgi:hypothetical protein